MRFFLIFLCAAGGFFAFFYFYPAAMFEATISSHVAEVTTDISLQTLLFKKDFPHGILAENVTAVSLTVKGVLIFIICLLALPAMIAYRFAKSKPAQK